jgi:hypothetical protein
VDVPRHTGAWVGAGILAALTVVVLIPAGWYVRLNLSDTGDWQTNHAQHEAAGRAVLLIIGCAGGGGLLALLATWLPRHPVPAAVRALAAASGAFTGGLLLTVIGFAWILSHAKLTFGY